MFVASENQIILFEGAVLEVNEAGKPCELRIYGPVVRTFAGEGGLTNCIREGMSTMQDPLEQYQKLMGTLLGEKPLCVIRT